MAKLGPIVVKIEMDEDIKNAIKKQTYVNKVLMRENNVLKRKVAKLEIGARKRR